MKEIHMPLVDVHCHLDAPAYQDLAAVCQQSRQAGVTVTVAAGKGLASNRHILMLQQQAPGQIWAALGFHPERLDASWEEVEAVIAQVQQHRTRVVAMGEVGLPHYTLLDKRMTQEQAQQHETFLQTLVQAAVRLSLPVVLHAPHAAAATALAIVKRYAPPGALFHWHKGTPAVTTALYQAGYFLSVTPEVCYRERDRQLVQAVPLDNLLLESDGPWPYGGEFTGHLTTSAMVARVAAEVAYLKGLPLEEVQAVTTANAYRLFGQPLPPSNVATAVPTPGA
jgi:TatD DNase family protein